jgi:hypothetical protein
MEAASYLAAWRHLVRQAQPLRRHRRQVLSETPPVLHRILHWAIHPRPPSHSSQRHWTPGHDRPSCSTSTMRGGVYERSLRSGMDTDLATDASREAVVAPLHTRR